MEHDIATSAERRASRDTRINVRASSRQEHLLRAAAAATDTTLTDFILGTAVTRAEKVLADRRYFLADQQQWDELQQLLNAPVPPFTPRIDALLSRPDRFTD